MPHIPTLTIGLALFMLVGWTFQPSREVLYLLAFVLLATVTEATYRHMDAQRDGR